MKARKIVNNLGCQLTQQEYDALNKVKLRLRKETERMVTISDLVRNALMQTYPELEGVFPHDR